MSVSVSLSPLATAIATTAVSDIATLRPALVVLVSLVGAVLILAAHHHPNLREVVTMLTALSMFGLVVSMIPGVLAGEVYRTHILDFLPGIEFTLRADPLGLLFALLASGLWIITSLYSIGYMRGLNEHNQTRYFAAFAVSLSATMGIAFAANLITMFVFYELLSVATYPLVAHDESAEARTAGRKYLAYTVFGGGVLVLAGTVAVYWLTGLVGESTVSFSAGGIDALTQAANAEPTYATLTFGLLAVGFAVKAGIMPLHQWLPEAMVAPTPVSGLLHAVAVVKSGAFGVARVVLDVFGPELVFDLGVGLWLSAAAAITLTAASLIAIRKDHLKRRLAYSTISQLSYILLGLGLFGWYGLVGALLHIPAHAFMKLTLFFCAGAAHVETHTDYISDMAGIGKRMPLTFGAFAVAAAGMAGIPLLAGFVSKYYLLIGGVQMGGMEPVAYYFAGALLLSGVLNIIYFWPVVYTAFFEAEDRHDAKPLIDSPLGGETLSLTQPRADGGHESGDDTNPDETDTGTDAESESTSELTSDAETAGEDESRSESPAEISETESRSPPTGVVEPSISGDGRDFDQPAEPVDEGEYAVDNNPSQTDVPFGADQQSQADSGHGNQPVHDDGLTGEHGETPTSHEQAHGHHGGPPTGGWTHVSLGAALRGGESTWFILAPILTAMLGAVALGLIPGRILFLELIELIVETRGLTPP